MKKKYLLLPAALLLLIFVLVIKQNQKEDLDSSIAIGCTGQEYTETENAAWLKVRFDEKDLSKTFAVKDEALKKELSGAQTGEILGVQILLHIPGEVLEAHHVDRNQLDPVNLLLGTSEYDEYCEIVGVSYK